jgi:hypothetical protein
MTFLPTDIHVIIQYTMSFSGAIAAPETSGHYIFSCLKKSEKECRSHQGKEFCDSLYILINLDQEFEIVNNYLSNKIINGKA